MGKRISKVKFLHLNVSLYAKEKNNRKTSICNNTNLIWNTPNTFATTNSSKERKKNDQPKPFYLMLQEIVTELFFSSGFESELFEAK